MSIHRIIIDSPETAAQFASICDLSPDKRSAAVNLGNYIHSLPGGVRNANVKALIGAVQATATIVSTGAAVNNETMLLLNVTLTAKTSGAVAANGEFNLSATPATQASNIAAAINAVASLQPRVSASANAGTVTVTSLVPGTIGNGLQISESLTNVTVTAFTGGSEGTSYNLALE